VDDRARAPEGVDPHLRSSALRLLAAPFRQPEEEVLEAFRGGEFEEALRDHASCIPHFAAALERAKGALEEARAQLAGTTFPDFEVAFTGTFLAGFPEPACPPYEGSFREREPRTQILLEVADFYRHFGLRMNPEEGKNEAPDHLRAELEFLQFLCLKEAQARQEGTPDLLYGYVLAQRDFLVRHLGVWVRPFAEALRARGALPWFGAAAGLLADHLDGEMALVERNLAGLPAPAPVEPPPPAAAKADVVVPAEAR